MHCGVRKNFKKSVFGDYHRFQSNRPRSGRHRSATRSALIDRKKASRPAGRPDRNASANTPLFLSCSPLHRFVRFSFPVSCRLSIPISKSNTTPGPVLRSNTCFHFWSSHLSSRKQSSRCPLPDSPSHDPPTHHTRSRVDYLHWWSTWLFHCTEPEVSHPERAKGVVGAPHARRAPTPLVPDPWLEAKKG